jgi:hypothetical protein
MHLDQQDIAHPAAPDDQFGMRAKRIDIGGVEAHTGGYTRGGTQASHTAQCVGPIRSRIGTALATRLFNRGKGWALGSW